MSIWRSINCRDLTHSLNEKTENALKNIRGHVRGQADDDIIPLPLVYTQYLENYAPSPFFLEIDYAPSPTTPRFVQFVIPIKVKVAPLTTI